MDLDVIVIGGIGIDTNVYLESGDVDFDVEANFTENLDYVGQAGGYYARGFAQLGYNTGLIDFIGKDFSAELIRNRLKNDSIDFLEFTDPTSLTRRSVNFMYSDGRRKNFYDGKGHMEVQLDVNKCRSFMKKTKFSHFNLMNWSRELLPVAKELGHTISCDLQDVFTIDDEYRQDFIDFADILFFSSVNYKDPGPLIKHLLKRKPDSIIISGMGSEGCVVGSREGVWYESPVNIIEDPVIDTNGAGDSLGVGFLSSYFIEGYSLDDSIKRGQIAARHICGIKASSSNLIRKTRLNELFIKLKRESKL